MVLALNQYNTALVILLYNFNFFYIFYNFFSIFPRQNISREFFSLNFLKYSIFFKKVSMVFLIKGVPISVIPCIFLLLFIGF